MSRLADDQHDLGPDYVVDSWLESWWSLALQLFPMRGGQEAVGRDVLPPPKYRVQWLDQEEANEQGVQGG